MIKNAGLVLEGGGMRGAYTSGVLAAFMDEGIKFHYVIGVSAGANNGANYVAWQRERNRKVFVDYVRNKEYSGFKHWIKDGSYFNMDFLFDRLPNELVPFDYDTFYNSPTVFKVCVTDCETGKPVYLSKDKFNPVFFMEIVLRASSSLPIISNPVEVEGKKYFDGGISDSIPINKSIEDGNKYNVVVLTRNKGYRKEKTDSKFINLLLKKYPKISEGINTRPERYNMCLDRIEELEKKNYLYVIRPIKEIDVDRLERDIDKLYALYKQGYTETMNQMSKFKKWLSGLKIENI